MKKGDKGKKILGLIVILAIIVSVFGGVVSAEDLSGGLKQSVDDAQLFDKNKITEQQKQQEILNMVNSHRGSLPAELILAITRSEGGEGAFHVDGWNYNYFYRERDGPWAQPTNGDGIMQVTTASGYHERSGPYTHDWAGYDHAINDGCDYLLAHYNTYGTHVQSTLHYNTGPNSLYIYLGKNWGDRDYLSHVAGHLSNFVPNTYALQNQNLVNALNQGQNILDKYLYDMGIATGQSVGYYEPYQTQLDRELHNIEAPNQPPTAIIDSITPDSAEQGTDTVSFTGHGTDPDGTVVAYNWSSSIDGQLSTSAAFTKPASELSVGTHTFYFTVQDDDGTWSSEDTEDLTINPADVPPTAIIDSITTDSAEQGTDTVSFTGHGTDTDGTVVAYNWSSSIDGPLSTSASFNKPASELSVGTHTFYFKVQDDDGTWSTEDTADLTIYPANVPPTAIIDSITPDPAEQGTDTVSFTGHGTDTDGTVEAYNWSSSIDGPLSTSAAFTKPASELSVGTHTFYFKVQDNDGAWSTEDTEDLTIYPANVPPTAIIDSITPDPAEQGTDTVSFSGHGTDPDGTVEAYNWSSSIDGPLSTSAAFTKPASELSVGTHTFYFTVQDNDGAWSTEDTEDLTIYPANVAPTAIIDSITPDSAEQGTDTVSFSGHGTDPDGTVVAYNWSSSIDGPLSASAAFTKPASELSVGTHTFYFKVQDDGGAWSTEDTADLTIDPANVPPTAIIDSITPDPAVQGTDTVSFTGHGTDTDGTVVAYTWSSSIDGPLSTSAAFTKPASELSVGTHTFYFKVQDNGGAWSTEDTEDLTIYPANVPPTAIIDSITPDPAEQGTDTVSFTGHGTDTDGTVVAYNWSSSIDGPLSTSAAFTKPASELSVGTHTFYFKVQDDGGAWSTEDTEDLTIDPANVPPTAIIDSITPDPAEQGTDTVSFTGHGTDTDGTVEAYNWSSSIDGPLSTSASFNKPASELSVGTHTFYFKVQDDGGAWSTEDTEDLTINPGPELSYSPESHDFCDMHEGETDNTTFEIWNSGTDTLTYSLSETCDWLEVHPTSGSSTGEHNSITVDMDTTGLFEGSHTCDITINSNDGSGTFTVMVNVVSCPCGNMSVNPTSWSPTLNCGESDNEIVTVSATGGTVKEVTVSKVSGPTWLSVSQTDLGDIASGSNKTFTITAAPPSETSGDFQYTVTVSNTCGSPSSIDVPGTIHVDYPESSLRYKVRKWTYMVYLDGDNDLEGAAIDDFMEMSSVGSTSDVNIVVQFDRIPGYSSAYGNWKTCKRFLVAPGMTPTPANARIDLGECNMGHPDTLRDFVEWAMTNFPANNYALILWNHGDGWKSIDKWVPWAADIKDAKDAGLTRGICWDFTNGSDSLTLQETEQALTGKYVQLLGYDACLMHMIEVVYQVRNNTRVSVGSEELEPWDGWPYDTILANLTGMPAMNEYALAMVIVDRYMDSYRYAGTETQSAMANSALPNLVTAVDNLAQALINEINGGHVAEVQQARTAAAEIYFTWSCYIDLYHFAEMVDTHVPGATAQAQAVMHEVSGSVYEAHGSSVPNDHGLSIYFPRVEGDYSPSYDSTAFASDTQWNEFLKRYYNVPEPILCTDPDPPSHGFGSVPEGQTRDWSFDITNCGEGTLTWTVSDDQSWITVTPPSDSTTTETDAVTVSIDTTGLGSGITHTGTVTVSSNGGTKQGLINVYVPEPGTPVAYLKKGPYGAEDYDLYIYTAPTTIGEHGAYTASDYWSPDGSTEAVATIDINGDGVDEIAYLKKGPYGDEDYDLYIYTAPTAIGEHGTLIATDYWSPDGNTVAITAIDIDGNGVDEIAYLKKGPYGAKDYDLYIYTAPTTIREHGTLIASDYWSPDGNTVGITAIGGGNEIAYLKKGPYGAKDYDLYIYTAPTTIREHGTLIASDYWSPDGDTVAITAIGGGDEIAYLKKGPYGAEDYDLYIYTAPTFIGEHGTLIASDYWSPDGHTEGISALG